MGIALEKERAEALPSVRLNAVGDAIVGALVDLGSMDAIDPKTNKPLLNDRGKPRQVQVITIRVISHEANAKVGRGDDIHEPVEGELAKIFVKGSTWQWWIEAKAEIDLEVGDVMRWKFTGTRPNATSGQSDYKDRKFEIRKSKPEDSQLVAECESIHHRLVDDRSVPENTEIDF